MAQDTIINVWVEGQIHSDGVSLSLLSESQEGGARVEAVENLTFEELESREGGLFNMGLSDETQSAFGDQIRQAQVGKLFESQVSDEPTHPEPGTVLTDVNAPSWSDEDGVQVTEVLSEVTAEEYVIQGKHEGTALDPSLQSWSDETVADANPSYSPDETVILGRYIDGGKEYAFPASRLQ